jgi:TP901 family phage tail tape measure protein
MTQTIAYLEAVVGADITSFRREMQNVRRELGILSDSAAGLQHLGRTLTLGLTTPLVAFGTAAVASASQFDAAMRNISSISEEFATNFEEASQRALDLGSNIRSGPMAAAEALYVVVSSGITDMETAFAIAEAGAMTAEAGLADVAGTTQALTSVMLAYGASADEAGTYSDILTRTVQVGVGSMEEFSGALSRIVPTANLLDISFQDIGAGLAFLTQRGIDASEASTALTGALKKILNPTEAMSTAFQELGVSSGSELIEQFGGLQGAMEALINTVSEGGNVDETALFDMFNEVRAFKAAASFANDLGAFGDAFTTFGAEVDGATARALQEQMSSFAAHFDLMKAALAGFAITVGNALLPILTPIVDGLTQLFLMAKDLPPELIMMGVAFAGVVAAAGPLLWIVGSLITPVGLLLGAVAGLGVAFATNFGGVRDSIIDTATKALPHLDDLATAVTDFFKLLTGEGDVPVPTDTTDFRSIFGGGGLNVNATEAITFTVEPGDVPGQIAAALQEAGHNVTWEQVLAATGTDAFLPGTYTMTVPGPSSAEVDLSNTTITMPNWWEQPLEYETSGGETESTLGGRLAEAVATAWPRVQEALEGLKTDISNWFTGTFIPGLDTIGAQILDAIAGIFSGGLAGADTPIYLAIRDFLNGGLQSAVSSFGATISTNLPQITAAFDNLFAAIGSWLQTDGIPGFGQTLGYILGTLGVLIRDGITAAINSIFGGGELQTSLNSFGTRFSQGFNQALIDTGGAETYSGGVNSILTGIVGAIATAMAGAALVNLLIGRGIGAALSSAVSIAIASGRLILNAAGWVFHLSAPAIAALGTKLSIAISGALAGLSSLLLPAIALALVLGIAALTFRLLSDEEFRQQFTDFLQQKIIDVGTVVIDAAVEIGLFTNLQPIENVQDPLNAALEGMGDTVTMDVPIDTLNAVLGDDTLVELPGMGAFSDYIQSFANSPSGIPLSEDGSAVTIQIPIAIAPVIAEQTGVTLPPEIAAAAAAMGTDYGTAVADSATLALAEGSAAIASSLLDNEQLTPEELATFAATMTAPIKAEFMAAFGEGGSVRVVLATWVYDMSVKLQDLQNAFINLSNGATEAMTILGENLLAQADPINQVLDSITAHANMLRDAFLAIINMGSFIGSAASALGINMPGFASGGMIDGGGMIGGRGMEFFAPGENGMIVPTRKLRDFMAGNAGGGGGDNYIVNAYGEAPFRVARMVEKAQKDRTRTRRKIR